MPVLATAPGVSLAYEDQAGEGPAVVLVHGWAMSGAAFSPLAAALAPSHRVVTVDLRGHGRSTAGPQAVEAHAGDVAALCEALDLRGATLVGWSFGGQVALAAAPRLGARAARLAFLGYTPRFTSGDDWSHGLPAAHVAALAARLRHRFAPALARFFDALFAPGELPEPERRAHAARVLEGAPVTLETALAGLDALVAADGRAALAALRLPALFVHGDRDAICLPAASAWAAARVPGARRAVIAGCGHAPHLSRTAEVAALLAGFAAEARA